MLRLKNYVRISPTKCIAEPVLLCNLLYTMLRENASYTGTSNVCLSLVPRPIVGGARRKGLVYTDCACVFNHPESERSYFPSAHSRV